jgi:hypothetical protein
MYDKALSIIIHPETAKHFTTKDLKKVVKLQIVNSLRLEGFEVDETTKFKYQVTSDENITVSVRAIHL